MNNDKPFTGVEVGALWLKDGKLSGSFGNARVAVIKNKFKEQNEKAPDYKIFIFPQEKRAEAPAQQQQAKPAQRPAQRPTGDLPF